MHRQWNASYKTIAMADPIASFSILTDWHPIRSLIHRFIVIKGQTMPGKVMACHRGLDPEEGHQVRRVPTQ
jgi:hypothetical protein